MRTAKNQYYLFSGFVERLSGYSYNYTFLGDQRIDEGEYYLTITDGILLFPARVSILKEGSGVYLVMAHIEDELDEVQFEKQMDYLSRRLSFVFGLESIDGVFYMPYEVEVQ